eukprot:Rhum_TRINITY_DN14423_c9_g2::Rhum_TRINITY_DN14423_c9_g2_i1::g.88997::m.88997
MRRQRRQRRKPRHRVSAVTAGPCPGPHGHRSKSCRQQRRRRVSAAAVSVDGGAAGGVQRTLVRPAVLHAARTGRCEPRGHRCRRHAERLVLRGSRQRRSRLLGRGGRVACVPAVCDVHRDAGHGEAAGAGVGRLPHASAGRMLAGVLLVPARGSEEEVPDVRGTLQGSRGVRRGWCGVAVVVRSGRRSLLAVRHAPHDPEGRSAHAAAVASASDGEHTGVPGAGYARLGLAKPGDRLRARNDRPCHALLRRLPCLDGAARRASLQRPRGGVLPPRRSPRETGPVGPGGGRVLGLQPPPLVHPRPLYLRPRGHPGEAGSLGRSDAAGRACAARTPGGGRTALGGVRVQVDDVSAGARAAAASGPAAVGRVLCRGCAGVPHDARLRLPRPAAEGVAGAPADDRLRGPVADAAGTADGGVRGHGSDGDPVVGVPAAAAVSVACCGRGEGAGVNHAGRRRPLFFSLSLSLPHTPF